MVLVLVAALAGARCVLVGFGAMAFLARHRSMQADQRKSRQIVIERNLRAPTRLCMAALALRAELPFMRVI